MNALPRITVAPSEHGWRALCTCGWRLDHINRPVVDLEAQAHRARCGRRG